MKPAWVPRIAAVVAVAAGLSGCFFSDAPLIAPGDAAFPYETIVYADEGGNRITMVHTGDVYLVRPTADSEGTLKLRFKALGGDDYITQAEFTDNGQTAVLYALMKVDWAAKRADSYAGVAPNDPPAGFTPCKPEGVCIRSLDAYIAYAQKVVADGGKPDFGFTIVSAE